MRVTSCLVYIVVKLHFDLKLSNNLPHFVTSKLSTTKIITCLVERIHLITKIRMQHIREDEDHSANTIIIQGKDKLA